MTQKDREAIERRIKYLALVKDLFERSLSYPGADECWAEIKRLNKILVEASKQA